MAEERKVLIPIDGSKHSDRAFNWYLTNLHQRGDKVVLVNTPEVPSLADTPYTYGGFVGGIDEYTRTLKENHEKSSHILEEYSTKLKDKEIPFETFSKVGSPGQVICNAARENSVAHIIMGCRGLGTVSRALLGSVSNYVVNHSDSPVSVVPPEKR